MSVFNIVAIAGCVFALALHWYIDQQWRGETDWTIPLVIVALVATSISVALR